MDRVSRSPVSPGRNLVLRVKEGNVFEYILSGVGTLHVSMFHYKYDVVWYMNDFLDRRGPVGDVPWFPIIGEWFAEEFGLTYGTDGLTVNYYTKLEGDLEKTCQRFRMLVQQLTNPKVPCT